MELPPDDELELDADGDLAPVSKEKKKARLNKHLSFARKKHINTYNDKQNKKRKKPDITKHNAKEFVDTYVEASKVIDEKVNVITSDVKDFLTEYYPETIEDKKVAWEPFPGPQTQFLSSDEDEVLFSGGRAPGKSDALMMDALRYCGNKDFRGLVIRKAMKDLRDLIKRAKDLYPLCYPGTKWKEQEKLFVFPSGATIEFGYCDHEDDVGQYQGQEYTWLGIDELTQLHLEETYEKLIASVRKSGAGLKNYIRATTNPNGPGKNWVKKRFVDKGGMGKTITISTFIPQLNRTIVTTRKWIHGVVFDNPKIMKERPEYIAMLQNIDNAILRKQWLEGDWDSADGLAFDEFDRKSHVIEPFDIPQEWYRFRACDWGYKTKAVNLWLAVDYDGQVYVYRELVTTNVLAKDFGDKIRQIEDEAGERIRYGILDASAWSQRGENAPPPAEDMGLVWRPSDRGAHSRLTGKLQVHNFLQKDPLTGEPKLKIFNTCTDLIGCLTSLPISDTNPEDVNTKVDDHSYDALRYGLMSRPRMNNNYNFYNQQSEQPVVYNTSFGY